MASRCTFALILCVATLMVGPAIAGDLEPSAGATATGVDAVRERPRISGTLYQRTEAKLLEAFPIAVEHVRNNANCRDLFARFGADGLEKLSSSLYYPSNAMMERRVCQGGVAAFTFIGGPQVRLCKRFASLGTERAAAVLIHEALHYAGQNESPRDPDAPAARDIDRMVKKACDF